MKLLKLLFATLLTLSLTACDIWNFNKGGKEDNPTGGGTGTVGSATELLLVEGGGQDGQLGVNFTIAFKPKMLDSKARPIPLDEIICRLEDCSNNVYDTGTAITNTSGEISYNPVPSFYGCGKVIFEVANSSYSVLPLVIPVNIIGPASSLTINSGDNQTITAGTSLSAVSVSAYDPNGVLVPSAKIDINGTTYTASSSGSLNYTYSTPSTTAGAHTFNIELNNGNDSKVVAYTVSPASPASLTIIGGNNQTITAGSSLGALSVKLADAFGNFNDNQPVDFDGTIVNTDANGEVSFTPSTTPTTVGSYQLQVSMGSLQADFDFSITAGALATLEVYSGDSQVLPRGVNSNSLVVRGKDAYGNIRTQGTDSISFTDGTWSASATMATTGLASVVYPTPLLTGNKTITASSGAVSTNFSLGVNDYTPLTATLSTSDDLTYSVITDRVYTAPEIINLGAVSVSPATILSSANTLTKTGSGTASSSALSAETSLNTSIVNVSSASDVLSITSTATFPTGVSSSSCSFSANVIDGLACLINGTMTFTRDKILGGNLSMRVFSETAGGPHDYKDTNTLATSKKIIIKKYTMPSATHDVLVAGGDATNKLIYIRSHLGRPAVFDYQNETITELASNIAIKGDDMYYHGGRFYFTAPNPSDSNNDRVLAYDPVADSFSEAFRVNAGADTITTSYLLGGKVYWAVGVIRRTVALEPDGTNYWTSSTLIGQYFPTKEFGGVEYGYLGILTQGIYRKSSATQITKVWNGCSSAILANTTNYSFCGTNTALWRYNATESKQIMDKTILGLLEMGDKLLIATKDASGYNKIFVWNDADDTYKKLRDFNSGASDFSDSDIMLIGKYNNNAYLCVKVGAVSTIFSYDGTKLSQLANSGVNCARISNTSVVNGIVVGDALWFGTTNSLYKICDQNLGCDQ